MHYSWAKPKLRDSIKELRIIFKKLIFLIDEYNECQKVTTNTLFTDKLWWPIVNYKALGFCYAWWLLLRFGYVSLSEIFSFSMYRKFFLLLHKQRLKISCPRVALGVRLLLFTKIKCAPENDATRVGQVKKGHKNIKATNNFTYFSSWGVKPFRFLNMGEEARRITLGVSARLNCRKEEKFLAREKAFSVKKLQTYWRHFVWNIDRFLLL